MAACTHEKFVEKARVIHGDHYEYLSPYNRSWIKITIKHVYCGHVFNMTPNNHLRGQRCPKCFAKTRKSHVQFVKQAQELHNYDYEYLTTYKARRSKIKIRHKRCGYEFWQTPGDHLSLCGCPKCKMSKGERKIFYWLQQHVSQYVLEHTFTDCINTETNERLKFDFFLPSLQLAIEFDGPQHFSPWRTKGISEQQAQEQFIATQKRDAIKNAYCANNNIKLLRIKYTEFDNISDILSTHILNSHVRIGVSSN